jgi:hypothetical protein
MAVTLSPDYRYTQRDLKNLSLQIFCSQIESMDKIYSGRELMNTSHLLSYSFVRKGFSYFFAPLILCALVQVGLVWPNIAYGDASNPNLRNLKIHTLGSANDPEHFEQYVKVTDLIGGGSFQIKCKYLGHSNQPTWVDLNIQADMPHGVLLTYYGGPSGNTTACNDPASIETPKNIWLTVKIQIAPDKLVTNPDNSCYFDPDPAHDKPEAPASLSGCVIPSRILDVQFSSPDDAPATPSLLPTQVVKVAIL